MAGSEAAAEGAAPGADADEEAVGAAQAPQTVAEVVDTVAGLLQALVAPAHTAAAQAFTIGDGDDLLRTVMAEQPERCLRPLVARLRSGGADQQLRAAALLRGLAHSSDREGAHDYQPLLSSAGLIPALADLLERRCTAPKEVRGSAGTCLACKTLC
jgi:hypothetical protein